MPSNRDEKTRELLRAHSKMLAKPDFLGNVLIKLLLLKLLIPKKRPLNFTGVVITMY